MTTEQFTEEILIKSHSLGIKEDVFALSKKLRVEDRTLDLHGSLQQAFLELTK